MSTIEVNRKWIPQSYESQLALREKCEAAFRRGLAWCILNPNLMTKQVRDQYMELRVKPKSNTTRIFWEMQTREFLECAGLRHDILFGFLDACDEEVRSYLSGIACGFDHVGLIADVVEERT